MEAYTFLREKNHTVPSETLELMKDSALKALEPVNVDLGDINESAKDVINYVEFDAAIAMPIDELMGEDGRRLTKKEYGKVLLKYLVIELKAHFL